MLVVMEMEKIRPMEKVSLTGKLLRLLGKNRGFGDRRQTLKTSRLILGSNIVGLPNTGNYYYNGKEIETALLESERKKAKALIGIHKHRFTY